MSRVVLSVATVAVLCLCVLAVAQVTASRVIDKVATEDADEESSLLQVASSSSSSSMVREDDEEGGGDEKKGGDDIENCEVCTYLITNKQQKQSYLCRGLTAESQQKVCTQVLESMMWWLNNQVYWNEYGCQRTTDSGATEWVRPCPAHVICGWIEDLNTRKPFCNPPDPQYPKPK